MDYNKKFLIIGNSNAITYKVIFPYLKDNQLWLGINWVKEFIQPNGEIKKFGNICWFTNIPHNKINKPLYLYRKYNTTDYPKYDNYDAINVDKVTDIPEDYDGVMGVPITFLDKYCPTQFEILWIASGHSKTTMPKNIAQILNANFELKSKANTGNGFAILNGVQLYHRLLIRKIK